MLARARQVREHGFRKYAGTPQVICRQVVYDCYTGRYFRTSTGHFSGFYIRDFAFAVPGLMKLGLGREVASTLQYALSIYSREKTLATAIIGNRPVHVFSFSPDSLPLLLYSLRKGGCSELAEIYKPFLIEQVDYYFSHVLDPRTGLVLDAAFSSMKDHHRRVSSCYDNCMMAMLSDELDMAGLKNPFRSLRLKEKIVRVFWNGSYFYDDLRKREYVAGDANTFAFWCNVAGKDLFEKALASIINAGLDRPFPLRYAAKRVQKSRFPFSLLLSDYEESTVWCHLGLCFMELAKKYRPVLFRKYMAQYAEHIGRHKNFLELFDKNKKPYIRMLYAADEGMIWAAKYLELS